VDGLTPGGEEDRGKGSGWCKNYQATVWKPPAREIRGATGAGVTPAVAGVAGSGRR